MKAFKKLWIKMKRMSKDRTQQYSKNKNKALANQLFLPDSQQLLYSQLFVAEVSFFCKAQTTSEVKYHPHLTGYHPVY